MASLPSSIIETGRLLNEAKDSLPHGEWGRMVKGKLPFDVRTAERLMEIARHPVIGNATHVSHLPPSWGTLYELSRIPEERCLGLIEDKTIHAGMTRDDATALSRVTYVTVPVVHNVQRYEVVTQVRDPKEPEPYTPPPQREDVVTQTPSEGPAPTDAPNLVSLAVEPSAPADDGAPPAPKLNAVGKPYSPNYDPSYKVPASSRSPNALRKPLTPRRVRIRRKGK